MVILIYLLFGVIIIMYNRLFKKSYFKSCVSIFGRWSKWISYCNWPFIIYFYIICKLLIQCLIGIVCFVELCYVRVLNLITADFYNSFYRPAQWIRNTLILHNYFCLIDIGLNCFECNILAWLRNKTIF